MNEAMTDWDLLPDGRSPGGPNLEDTATVDVDHLLDDKDEDADVPATPGDNDDDHRPVDDEETDYDYTDEEREAVRSSIEADDRREGFWWVLSDGRPGNPQVPF